MHRIFEFMHMSFPHKHEFWSNTMDIFRFRLYVEKKNITDYTIDIIFVLINKNQNCHVQIGLRNSNKMLYLVN